MTKKIAVVGSMINSSEYLLFENLETGYSLERYDSVEEARNSDCDAVYFAPGWVDSKGCNLEYAAAKIYGKTIYT